jgi:hypothetical protein
MYVFMYVYVAGLLCMPLFLAKRVKQKTNNYRQSHDVGFCILIYNCDVIFVTITICFDQTVMSLCSTMVLFCLLILAIDVLS